MSYLRAACWLLGALVGVSTFTAVSLPLPLSNGSTNLVLSVDTVVGRAVVGPSSSLEWWCDDTETVAYLTNGVSAGTWLAKHGHSYGIYVGALGVTVLDKSQPQTAWFFAGLGFGLFCCGMAVFARLTFRTLGGGFNE